MDTNKQVKKTNGVRGKSSNAAIKQRKELGIKIIQQANYKITEQDFLDKYEKKINSIGNTCPTMRTLKKDMKDIEVTIRESQRDNFKFLDPNASSKSHSTFINIGEDIFFSIKTIILSLGTLNFPIYNLGMPKIPTLDKLKKYIHTKIDTELSEEPKQDQMTRIFIIYNEPGYEKYLSSLYKKQFPDFVLYTSSHEYCSEIVFSYKKLNMILKKTHMLLKYYIR